MSASVGAASAETRTLKIYFIHTKERAEVTFKKNGKYIPSGIKQINQLLRDWRRNEPAKLDPKLLDLVWEVYRAVGGRDYIHVVSAYRSPATNAMLRKRSSGVAEKSQHMLGKAMDFYIPGVSLAKIRAAGFRAQTGGVGYYPKSGAPFVHLDVGNVRAWPRMSRSELLALFPDGKTLHIPTDGKPLPGFNQALAAYKSGKKSSSAVQMASVEETDEKKQGFFARLFGAGGGADAEEDANDDGSVQVAAAAPASRRPEPAAQRPAVAAAAPAAATALANSLLSAPAAGEQPAEEGEIVLALNAPVPGVRPTLPGEQPAEVAPPAAEAPIAVAAVAETARTAADIIAGVAGEPKPAEQPAPSATLAAFLPSARPETGGDVLLAALPRNEAGKAARQQAQGMVDERLARLAAAPDGSPRRAVIARDAGVAPEAAVASGVRTTAKGSKPSAVDTRPDPRAVLIPVPQQVARWALSNEPVTMDPRGTTAPSFAHAQVWTAPREVYTAGFQSPDTQSQAHRFTGNAVTFMSVAKFATN